MFHLFMYFKQVFNLKIDFKTKNQIYYFLHITMHVFRVIMFSKMSYFSYILLTSL